MHRRARALKSIQRACASKLISSANLIAFLMPLVRSFLDDERYAKYDFVIDEASNSVGAICRCLSWARYYKILDFHLKTLKKESINPKVTIK
jgi:U3 small nucleolar RNA-associated protein 20